MKLYVKSTIVDNESEWTPSGKPVGVMPLNYNIADEEDYESIDYGFGADSNGEYIDESTVEELCRIAQETLNDSDLEKVFDLFEIDPDTWKENYYNTGTYSGTYLKYEIYAKTNNKKLDISDCMDPNYDGAFVDLSGSWSDNYECKMKFTLYIDHSDEIVDVVLDDVAIYEYSQSSSRRYDSWSTERFSQAYDIEKICNKVADDFEPVVREIHSTVSNI